MSLQLELDQERHIQEHLNELTSRTTLVFFLSTVFTLGWLTQIDQILDVLLDYKPPTQNTKLPHVVNFKKKSGDNKKR